MDLPVFRKAIALTGLTRIAMPVGAVVPFDEGGVDLRTNGRSSQRDPDAVVGAKNGAKIHLDDASLSPRLVHGGLVEIRRGEDKGILGTTRFAGAGRNDFFPVGLMNRALVGFVFVTGKQLNGGILGATLEFISVRTKEALTQRKAKGLPLGRSFRPAQQLKLDPHREEIVGYLNNGVSKRSVAKIVGCSPSTLYDWIKRHKIAVRVQASP